MGDNAVNINAKSYAIPIPWVRSSLNDFLFKLPYRVIE